MQPLFCISLLDGHIDSLDATSAILGVVPHFSLDGDLGGYLLRSVLGAIVVLVVGTIWRRRKLRDVEHEAALCGRREDRCSGSDLAPDDRSGAADQPRQLLEAAADAVGDEIDHLVLEHQHQLAALAAEMGRGQHAGPRRRDQMRDAERRAEHAGALEHRRRHQFAG